MDNIKPALTVSQFIKVNELANLTNIHDLHNETGCVRNSNEYEIRLLHHNVQSLNNKLLNIAIMLPAENLNVILLCSTEQWLSEVHINVLNTDYFRLVSNFSKVTVHRENRVFARNTTETKEVNFLREMGIEKVSKLSAVELSDIDTILACI